MSVVLKLFGERNTGTRAVAKMLSQVPDLTRRIGPRPPASAPDVAVEAAIEASMKGGWKRLYLHAMRDDLAARGAGDDPWKHALPRLTDGMVAARARTLIMVRDPYSWTVALARRPYHLKGPPARDLEGFAARPWMTERREGLPAVLASPIDLWSLKMRAGLEFREAAHRAGLRCRLLRFEDFVADPVGALSGALADLEVAHPPLRARTRNTKRDEPGLTALQDYYARELWQDRLSAETVRRINLRVDWEAAATLGYRRRAPEAFPERLPPHVAAEVAAEMASLTAPSQRDRRRAG